jgi:hypothetical protein
MARACPWAPNRRSVRRFAWKKNLRVFVPRSGRTSCGRSPKLKRDEFSCLPQCAAPGGLQLATDRVKALVVADSRDEPVGRGCRIALLTTIEVRSNQQVGADEDSVVEHEQPERGWTILGGRRSRNRRRMRLARRAACAPRWTHRCRPAVPPRSRQVFRRQACG